MTSAVIRCGACGSAVDVVGSSAACICGRTQYSLVDGIYVREGLETDQESEMLVRDLQADGYLKHDKFPTQIASFDRWLKQIVATVGNTGLGDAIEGRTKIALDLGCGPGPYTKKLQDLGFHVVAIDFSAKSLRINAHICKEGVTIPTFLQENLNDLALVENSIDMVVMADFLQHLGGRGNRERLLREVFKALRKGGPFYLSFFNLNIKNYIKSDVHGGFANGKIRYERLAVKNVISDFPADILVDRVLPMNVVHGARLDRLLGALPLALYLSRMVMVTGRKNS